MSAVSTRFFQAPVKSPASRHGLHRQRDLQRDWRAHQNAAIESGERIRGQGFGVIRDSGSGVSLDSIARRNRTNEKVDA